MEKPHQNNKQKATAFSQAVATLRDWIERSSRIVFFGGAGVSTESGIPDFRSEDGLYRQTYDYPPETILSDQFFYSHTEEFYRFYRDKMLCPNAQPNDAHQRLALLERRGKLLSVITQNIDGLHQKAGSRRVLELHGSIWRNRCLRCGKEYTLEHIAESAGVPHCSCGGIIKPEVVLYGEQLDSGVLQQAVQDLKNADLVIVGGTSLSVYPAAGLLDYYQGHLALINKSPTSYDSRADLLLPWGIGRVLRAAVPESLTE